MEFFNSKSPQRLAMNIPCVPLMPEILSISGENELEPFGFNQRIQLNINGKDAHNWKVVLECIVPKIKPTKKADTVYTRNNSTRVILRHIDAGREYNIYVM